jgi:hypothetical protein
LALIRVVTPLSRNPRAKTARRHAAMRPGRFAVENREPIQRAVAFLELEGRLEED